jgi:hypothetical protein
MTQQVLSGYPRLEESGTLDDRVGESRSAHPARAQQFAEDVTGVAGQSRRSG